MTAAPQHRTTTALLLPSCSLAGVALALALLTLLPPPTTTRPTEAAATPTIPHIDVPPLGANFFLEREVEDWKREMTVSMARAAGIRWARQMFTWEELEPRKGEFFDEKFRKSTWEKYDAIVDLAERHGIRIIARLERPPTWARRDNTYAGAPADDPQDYFDFVRTVVSRYKGRVQHYQVWTEPNIWPEWGAKGVDPEGYTALLRGAYLAVKETDPDALVLSATLAQTLEESPRNLSELKYLDRMYRAGAGPYFDILSANAYGFDAPPDAPPDPAALNFSRLLLLRQVMERHGDAGKPVWFNEFGWNAAPETFPAEKLTWRRVSEQQQAVYTAAAVRLARSWNWVGVLNYWYFRHVGDIPVANADYFFRMVDVDFTPRPIYHQLKRLGQELAIAPPGTHGELHPAVETTGRWRGGSAPHTGAMPAAGGGSGTAMGSVERVLWNAGAGGSVSISFDGTGASVQVFPPLNTVSLRLIVDSRDAAGPSIIEVPAADSAIPVTVPVITGLPPRPHTIQLEEMPGAQPGTWALDGFFVENAASSLPFWGALLLLGISLAGLTFSLRRRRQR